MWEAQAAVGEKSVKTQRSLDCPSPRETANLTKTSFLKALG